MNEWRWRQRFNIYWYTTILFEQVKMKNLSIVECYSIHTGAVSNVHSDEESFWPSHKLRLNQLPLFSNIPDLKHCWQLNIVHTKKHQYHPLCQTTSQLFSYSIGMSWKQDREVLFWSANLIESTGSSACWAFAVPSFMKLTETLQCKLIYTQSCAIMPLSICK